MADKMNQKNSKRKRAKKIIRLIKKLMKLANKDSIFMHCLPASTEEKK